MKTVFKSLELAARAYGRAHGVSGRAGGWVYNEHGVRIVQGWQSYGELLVRSGEIDPQDKHGASVRTFQLPGETRIMPRNYWFNHADQYALVPPKPDYAAERRTAAEREAEQLRLRGAALDRLKNSFDELGFGNVTTNIQTMTVTMSASLANSLLRTLKEHS